MYVVLEFMLFIPLRHPAIGDSLAVAVRQAMTMQLASLDLGQYH